MNIRMYMVQNPVFHVVPKDPRFLKSFVSPSPGFIQGGGPVDAQGPSRVGKEPGTKTSYP